MNFLLAIATIFLLPTYQLLSYGVPIRMSPAAPPSNHHLSCGISRAPSDSPINQIRQMRQRQSVHHHHHKKQVSQQHPHNTHDGIYQQELFSLEQELVTKGCYAQHQQRRLGALRATQSKGDRTARAINVDDNVQFFAQQYDISSDNLKRSVFNPYEYQLHSEFLEQLSQTAQLKYFYNDARDYRVFIDAVGYGVSCGIDANNNHQVIQATQWADFGWQVLDLAKAALEGVALGVYHTAAFAAKVVAHPLETIKTVAHGAATITASLVRATGAILRFQALEEHGYHEQLHAELDQLADQINVVIDHCSEQLATIPLREKVKHVVAFGTEIMVPIKVFKVAHTLCSRMRPMVATMLNVLRDEQVGIEIAGVGENIGIKVAEGAREVVGTAKVVLSEAQLLLKNFHIDLLKKLEPEIAALRLLFDNRVKGFGEFANKYIKIAYEHILGIELSFSKRGVPSIGGFHHDFMHAVKKSNMFEFVDEVIHASGFYKAKLLYKGDFVKEITFFPAQWSRERVISSVYEAYENFLQSGMLVKINPDGKYVVKGFTREGIEIEMFITQKGRVTTAYPIL
jgi:hypothetical protein